MYSHEFEGYTFVGRSIKAIRPISKSKLDAEGWTQTRSMVCMVIELDDGTSIYPSSDPEGNRPGCLFATLPCGTDIYVPEEH